MSIKSAAHKSSIPLVIMGLLLKSIQTGLCNSLASKSVAQQICCNQLPSLLGTVFHRSHIFCILQLRP
jgi:hypothetical protein